MDVRTVRRKRLEQLLELAQASQGCSRKELARIRGRDRTKLVPTSGVPELAMLSDPGRGPGWPAGDGRAQERATAAWWGASGTSSHGPRRWETILAPPPASGPVDGQISRPSTFTRSMVSRSVTPGRMNSNRRS